MSRIRAQQVRGSSRRLAVKNNLDIHSQGRMRVVIIGGGAELVMCIW